MVAIKRRDKRPAVRGPKGAIAAMCWDCIFDEAEPESAADQIEACTITSCPLFGFRPRTSALPSPDSGGNPVGG